VHLGSRRDDLQGLRLLRRLQTSSALFVRGGRVEGRVQSHGDAPVYAERWVEHPEQVLKCDRALKINMKIKQNKINICSFLIIAKFNFPSWILNFKENTALICQFFILSRTVLIFSNQVFNLNFAINNSNPSDNN